MTYYIEEFRERGEKEELEYREENDKEEDEPFWLDYDEN